MRKLVVPVGLLRQHFPIVFSDVAYLPNITNDCLLQIEIDNDNVLAGAWALQPDNSMICKVYTAAELLPKKMTISYFPTMFDKKYKFVFLDPKDSFAVREGKNEVN